MAAVRSRDFGSARQARDRANSLGGANALYASSAEPRIAATQSGQEYRSGVIIMPEEFDILDHSRSYKVGKLIHLIEQERASMR